MNDNSLDKIVIATRNLGKVREMLHLFQSIKVPFGTLAEHRDTTDIEETGTTFAENAELKAAAYARQTGHWCLPMTQALWSPHSTAGRECCPHAMAGLIWPLLKK